MIQLFFVFLVAVTGWQSSYAHGGKKHNSENKTEVVTPNQIEKQLLEKINTLYIKNVKPIFKAKCLDCHGAGNRMPWYFNLPVAKQIMEYDMAEAKEHLDMSRDFPFGGHGTPSEDLKELAGVVEGEDMPPWQYKLMHWNSSLTKNEKLIVMSWIKESQKTLKGK